MNTLTRITRIMHQFDLTDGARIGRPDWDDEAENLLDGRRTTLARLKNDEQFVYEFDFGDSWTHLCTVGPSRIDPIEQLGILPDQPLPYWGWGDIPDQYGQRWDGDDGEELSRPGPDPELIDLPPLGPEWGPRPGRYANDHRPRTRLRTTAGCRLPKALLCSQVVHGPTTARARETLFANRGPFGSGERIRSKAPFKPDE